jgi:hypothetical protein
MLFRLLHTQRFFTPAERTPPGSGLGHSDASPALGAQRKNLYAGFTLLWAAPVIMLFRLLLDQRFFTPAERTPPGSE